MESPRITTDKEASFQIIETFDADEKDWYQQDVQDFACGDTKICKQCGIDKPLSAFRIEKMGKGGRKAICKMCVNQTSITREEIIDAVADKLIMRMSL